MRLIRPLLLATAALFCAPLQAAPAATPPAPGYTNLRLAPAKTGSMEEAISLIRSRRVAPNLNQGVKTALAARAARMARGARVAAAATTDTAPEIVELARALRGDPDLIYEYVRNNIEFYPIWGIQKGALGALIEGQGTAFDQAELMVALLRQSGIKASFQYGAVTLNATQLRDWMGLDADQGCGAWQTLVQAGMNVRSVDIRSGEFSCPGGKAALNSITFDHLWVVATIGGKEYHFDPSLKAHTTRAPLDLAAITGYTQSAYLSAARTGATLTPDYVQGINRTAIRANLTTYATKLAAHLRAKAPTARIEDVIGERTLIPQETGKLRQTQLPYEYGRASTGTWDTIPDPYRATLRVVYRGIDRTFTSDSLAGRRLTLTFDNSGQPLLKLDGETIATGQAASRGTPTALQYEIGHSAYNQGVVREEFGQYITAGGTYLIANTFGPANRKLVEHHRTRLEEAKAAGLADDSEPALGSSLAMLAAVWTSQDNRVSAIINSMLRSVTLYHHQVGIAGHYTAPFVDLPGNTASFVSLNGDMTQSASAFYNAGMHGSIFESTSVQQNTGASAVSTVKLIDMAVAANLKIFSATAANYNSQVAPNLSGCGAYAQSFINDLSAGNRLIVPERCTLSENSWTGVGYYRINADENGQGSMGAIISGGLYGGFATTPQPPSRTSQQSLINVVSPSGNLRNDTGNTWADPIDMAKGQFLLDNTDLTVGQGGHPASLSFQRRYSSGLRHEAGSLGRGWTHNFNLSIATGSDGMQGMGEDSALDAVGTLVELMVATDLLADPAKPLDKMVIANVGQRWFADQLLDNTVVVRDGLNGQVFVKLPDGSYNPPPGNASRLTRNTDGSFSLETASRDKIDFGTNGKITRHAHPAGIEARFTYTGNDLTRVTNSLGYALDFTWSNARITRVSDGTRSVAYTYDANANLTAFANTLGAQTTFKYDQPGRITQLIYPSSPTAFVTNTYDTLGRVATQINARGSRYDFYFAGSRSEEVGPGNTSRISYLDDWGRIQKSVSPTGAITRNTYDGQGRPTATVMPEGNSIAWTYDDAPCAAAEKRCTHNIQTQTRAPRAGSKLPPQVTRFSYESAFNKLASLTDPRGNLTRYTYTAQGQAASVTAPPDASGVSPTTTYTYTAFRASGFPTFYLPTATTTRLDASRSTTTLTTYDAQNHYLPKTLTADAGSGKLNLITTLTHDGIGNLIAADGPRTDLTDITRTRFDTERRPTETTDALGNTTRISYDPDGRPTRTASKIGTQWLVACRNYTASGKLARAWGPAITNSDTTCPTAAAPVAVTDTTYDTLDRPSRVTETLPAGDGGNRITDTTYNADDTVSSVKRAVGTTVAQTYATWTYNKNGQPLTVKDAKNNLTAYVYDDHLRPIQTRYPDKTKANTASTTDTEKIEFDANGNPTAITKRSGQRITQTFDKLNRLIARSYPTAADNLTFAYDLTGRRTESRFADGRQVIRHTWDAAGRLTATTAGKRTLTHQLDAAGNRIRTTWPDGFYITRQYDAANRLTTLKENGNLTLASFTLDALNRRTAANFGNATATTQGYNPQGTLASLTHNLTGTTGDIAFSYTRNPLGEITQHSWSNDKYQWKGTNATTDYRANGLNQYTQVGTTPITHDANGNLTADGTWAYGFDADNRLRTASKTGTKASLDYDPEGRLQKTTFGATSTELLYDGTELIAEYDTKGTLLRRYIHGPGVDEPLVWYEGSTTANKQWLYADHLGSIIATADAKGQSTSTLAYGPFGEPNQSTGVRFRYTGQQFLAPLNLYYYKARVYSPQLGRFLQTDPIGHKDDLNLYAYVGNNPLNRVDPFGLAKDTRGWGSTALDALQLGLTGAGLVPVFGEAFDVANAGISAARGDWIGAGLNLASAIPVLGYGATTAKVGREVVEGVGKEANLLSKEAQKGINSLEKQITSHEKKLDDFRANPTVRPGMENLPKDVIEKQQQSRIQHLEKEIQTFKNNIQKLLNGDR